MVKNIDAGKISGLNNEKERHRQRKWAIGYMKGDCLDRDPVRIDDEALRAADLFRLRTRRFWVAAGKLRPPCRGLFKSHANR